MNQNLKLSFVNPEGKDCDSYITWTPSKMRIHIPSHFKKEHLILDQSSFEVDKSTLPEEFHSQITTPEVLFYNNPLDKEDKGVSSMTIDLGTHLSAEDIFVYVGGKFQKGKLYNGASPDSKDIKITAKLVTDRKEKIVAEVSEDVMIRVRKNANQLTTKAKKEFLFALSSINERDKEGNAVGIYSKDFFNMHVKGSKSIAHGTEVFLPWHRLYILDLERQLQNKIKEVSLHYWKFDEGAEHVFTKEFMGEALIDNDKISSSMEGYSSVFARFDENNPLINWSINSEKLLRRKSNFDYNSKSSYFSIDKNGKKVLEEVTDEELSLSFKRQLAKVDTLSDKKYPYTGDSFTTIEINPHGTAHTSHNGFINFVPTAPKDPIFFLLHSNVDRLWAKWQTIHTIKDNNFFDPYNEINYPKHEKGNNDWKNVDSKLWPWNGRSTPNDFHFQPPGTRKQNFTKSDIVKNFESGSPSIKNSLDAFGNFNYSNNLGFGYDDTNAYFLETNLSDTVLNNILKSFEKDENENKILLKQHLKVLGKDFNNIINDIKKLDTIDSTLFKSLEKKPNLNSDTVKKIIKDLSIEKLVSNADVTDTVNLEIILNLLLSKASSKEDVDSILIQLVHNDNRDIIHQLEKLYENLENDFNYVTSIRYYKDTKDVDYSKVSDNDGYETKEFSKGLVIYLLALYDFEYVQDERIYNFISKNSSKIFEKINLRDISSTLNQLTLEEDLDLLINLLTFASNTTLLRIYNEFIGPEFLSILNSLSSLNNKGASHPVSDRILNKFWALNKLFENSLKFQIPADKELAEELV